MARELVDLANSAMLPELFTPGFRIVEICDQIGFMRQKLRAWLVAGAQQVAA